MPFGDLVFDMRLSEVVEALEDESFQHSETIQGVALGGAFAGVQENLIEGRAEDFQIDVLADSKKSSKEICKSAKLIFSNYPEIIFRSKCKLKKYSCHSEEISKSKFRNLWS